MGRSQSGVVSRNGAQATKSGASFSRGRVGSTAAPLRAVRGASRADQKSALRVPTPTPKISHDFGRIHVEAGNAPAVDASAPKPATAVQPATARAAPTTAAVPPVSATANSVDARDPATLIETARLEGQRTTLPHGDQLRDLFDWGLGAIAVYRGTAARRACEALDARALTVHNIVIFRDDAPSLLTVLHELAHVLQQRAAGSSPERFEPGSLGLASASESAEREAEHFARGGLRPADLTRAPIKVYRDGEGLLLEDNGAKALPAIEQRLRAFLKESEFKVEDRPIAVFCASKADGKADAIAPYRKSTPRPFKHEDYKSFPKSAEGVVGDLPELLRKRGNYWRLSRVMSSEKAAEDSTSRKYAVTDSGTYKEVVFEIAGGDKKTPTAAENAISLQKYRKALNNVDRLKGWTWSTTTFKGGEDGGVKGAKVTGSETETAVSAETLSDARHEMEAKIVETYKGNLKLLFEEIIQPTIFAPPYSRIQGNIFELWLKENWSEFLPEYLKGSGQVMFLKEGPLTKNRFGDFALKGDKGFLVGEAKGVAGPPQGEQLEQMKAYFIIVKDKIKGRFAPNSKAEPQTFVKETFTKVRYVFSDKSVALTHWLPELRTNFPAIATEKTGKIAAAETAAAEPVEQLPYEVFAGSEDLLKPKAKGPKKKVIKGAARSSPAIEFTITNADDASNLKHEGKPSSKNPGVKVSQYKVTLREAGYPAIESGELTMDLDVPGAPLSAAAPAVKKLKPTEPEAEPAGPSKSGYSVVGSYENKLDKLEPSGLDKFLKRVHAEAKLVDDGIGGRIWVDPGASGIAKINLVKADIEIGYSLQKHFWAKGEVDLAYAPAPDKFSAHVEVKYEQNNWSFLGSGTIAGLIDGLDPIKVSVSHSSKDGLTKVWADKVKITKKFTAVTLTGTIDKLVYDVAQGDFSADKVALRADLGAFGNAGAEAKIANNEITKVTLLYDSPKLLYPKKNPVFDGTITGQVSYEKQQFSGEITGDATLKIPALDKVAKGLGDLGLKLVARVDERGAFSGSIDSTKPVKLGKHFEVAKVGATLAPDGKISSNFVIGVVDLSILKKGEIHCAIGPDGFSIVRVDVEGQFGDPAKGKYWGVAGITYEQASHAFIIGGSLNYRIREGMIAVGTIRYNSITQVIDTTLTVGRIQLLEYKKQFKLLELSKQIELVSFYKIIGVYLDLGFDLIFDFDFNLAIEPTFSLKGLNLIGFTFDEIEGRIKLIGGLRAALTATPYIGLGVFAFSPSVLRAGGGLRFPTVAEAKLSANAVLIVRYTPEGDVKGAAKAALALTFGITASIRPYAEFAVLDDLYQAKWNGDALAAFTILPERELFTYIVDFGKEIKKEENPQLPSGNRPPPALGADTQRVAQDKGQAKEAPIDSSKKDTPAEEKGKPPKDEQGFSIVGLIKGLKSGESYQKVEALLDAVREVWGALAKIWEFVVKFFKNWYDRLKDLLGDVVAFIKKLGKEGLMPTIKMVLLKVLGQDIYDIIVPVLDALQGAEKHFLNLLEKPLPTSPGEFFGWAIDVLSEVLQIAFDGIVQFAKAIVEVVRRAAEAGGRFVNGLVKHKKIGVERQVRYVGSETLGLAHYFLSADHYKIEVGGIKLGDDARKDSIRWPSPSAAIAFGLWEALDHIPQVKPTNPATAPDANEPFNDYWA